MNENIFVPDNPNDLFPLTPKSKFLSFIPIPIPIPQTCKQIRMSRQYQECTNKDR